MPVDYVGLRGKISSADFLPSSVRKMHMNAATKTPVSVAVLETYTCHTYTVTSHHNYTTMHNMTSHSSDLAMAYGNYQLFYLLYYR